VFCRANIAGYEKHKQKKAEWKQRDKRIDGQRDRETETKRTREEKDEMENAHL